MTQNTKKWLVKLKPMHQFFFGGERIFRKKGEDKADYLMRSNYFPQQTAVLGMVRYLMLKNCANPEIFANNRIQDKNKAADLIGKQSFSVDDDFEFGKIKGLSPLFVRCEKANKNYFPLNREYLNGKENELLQLTQKYGHYCLKNYDPKDGLVEGLTDLSAKIRLSYQDIFREERQVGIRKNYKGKTEDNAYYLQYFKKFQPTRKTNDQNWEQDLRFAFHLELDKTVKFDFTPETPAFVTLGAEQQVFALTTEQTEENFHRLLPNYEASENYDKLVLVSDAMAPAKIEGCEFAIADTIPFRFLTSTVEENGNYYSLPSDKKRTKKGGKINDSKPGNVKRSKRFELYKRGSVFYGDVVKIAESFENENFKSLGYNHFEIKNKEKNGNSNT